MFSRAGRISTFLGQQAGQLHQRFLGATFEFEFDFAEVQHARRQLGMCVAADLNLVDGEFNQRGRRLVRAGQHIHAALVADHEQLADFPGAEQAGQTVLDRPRRQSRQPAVGDEQPLFDLFADLNGAVAQTQPLESQGLLAVAVAQAIAPAGPKNRPIRGVEIAVNDGLVGVRFNPVAQLPQHGQQLADVLWVLNEEFGFDFRHRSSLPPRTLQKSRLRVEDIGRPERSVSAGEGPLTRHAAPVPGRES